MTINKEKIEAIKKLAELELEDISRADEEYQKDSVNYMLTFIEMIGNKEVEMNMRYIVQDFRMTIYRRYLSLILYCEKLLQMGE